jgi:hypothetical protein
MSKRNAKNTALPGSTLTIGLDIGYGVVKAVTADQVVMFPSVMGHAGICRTHRRTSWLQITQCST